MSWETARHLLGLSGRFNAIESNDSGWQIAVWIRIWANGGSPPGGAFQHFSTIGLSKYSTLCVDYVVSVVTFCSSANVCAQQGP